MIPSWRGPQTRMAPCGQCRVNLEISILARGMVYCPDCRQSRRRQSLDRANHKARTRRRLGPTQIAPAILHARAMPPVTVRRLVRDLAS